MPRNPTATRESILDAAQDLILIRGFAGTSLDEILERTGLTKGAFFHHFRSKQDLAHSLILRYAAEDARILEELSSRAEDLSRDPLQQVLILLGLYAEAAERSKDSIEGCLFASYGYQAGLFDHGTNDVVREALEHWRDDIVTRFQAAIDTHPPRLPASAHDLGESALAIFEGAYVVSLSLHDPSLVGRQIRQFRTFVEALFAPVGSTPQPMDTVRG